MREPIPGIDRCLLVVPRNLKDKLLSLDWGRNLSSVLISVAWPYKFSDGTSRRLVETKGQFLNSIKNCVVREIGSASFVIEMDNSMVVISKKDNSVSVKNRYDFTNVIWEEYFTSDQFDKVSLFIQRAIKANKINSIESLKAYVTILKKLKVGIKRVEKKTEYSFEIEES